MRPLYLVLPWPALLLPFVSQCAWVCWGGVFVLSAPIYSCVLPLSFTVEKGTTPLRPRPSVCVCGVFGSLGIWGFILQSLFLCSSPIQNILTYLCIPSTLEFCMQALIGTQVTTCTHITHSHVGGFKGNPFTVRGLWGYADWWKNIETQKLVVCTRAYIKTLSLNVTCASLVNINPQGIPNLHFFNIYTGVISVQLCFHELFSECRMHIHIQDVLKILQ